MREIAKKNDNIPLSPPRNVLLSIQRVHCSFRDKWASFEWVQMHGENYAGIHFSTLAAGI